MPMHQAEAMWLNFSAYDGELGVGYPFAVKVATGKINAISGEEWSGGLNQDPQDYAVIPKQPWLDGYCVEKGLVRQFVAMPLGACYSVEEQVTGAAEHGGLQVMVWPMKAVRYEQLLERERNRGSSRFRVMREYSTCSTPEKEMGLAPSNRMRQEIYDDPYGLDAWDQRNSSRCFVTIANSTQWIGITGERPPTEPPTAAQYTEHGFPWFDYYDGDAKAIEGVAKLGKLKSVRETDRTRGLDRWPDTDSVASPRVHRLGPTKTREVREANF